MSFVIATALLVSAANHPANTCANLKRDFDSNEHAYAIIHDTEQRIFEIDRTYANAIGSSDAHASVSKDLETMQADDEKYKTQGDHITTLLIANKCPPPDHVTSWMTYSTKTP